MRYAIALVFCLLAGPLFAENTWEPGKTWVFAVGILEFEASKVFGSFPKEGRRDQVFMDTLEKRGVPKANIVFIKDTDATKDKLTSEFETLLKKAATGDTLIFYYAGHGVKDDQHNAYFVPNDCKLVKKGYDTCWSVSSVFDTIEKNFKGSTVLVTADCCHCGAVCTEAGKRASKIAYGTLVSAHLNTVSTPRWTFTNVLIDTFGGNAMVDTDGNEKTTFAETAYYAETEMAFFEQQLSVSGVCNGFDRYIVLAKPAKRATTRLGECVEGEWDKKWYKCKIYDYEKKADGEELFRVTWVGYKADEDAWLPASRLRRWKPESISGGTECEVESDGKWYKAKVKEHKLGLHLVHYDGYPDADDEWVKFSRIKVKK